MSNHEISAQKNLSPELISAESMRLMAHDHKTIKRLTIAALCGLLAYVSATFATVLQISMNSRFEWLGVCIVAFIISLIFLSLAIRKAE
jgi:hypothetical protein